ncbi:MAG TPA: hypothetical protein VKE72_10035 [Methylocella sp.]|nr:hypothetical protein [Methylocella sp.]
MQHLAKQANACNNNLFVSRPPNVALTEADFQQADLLLSSLYDAAQYAECVAMKLDCVATALRRRFISYDSAINWLSDLRLLDYVLRPEFSYEAVQ